MKQPDHPPFYANDVAFFCVDLNDGEQIDPVFVPSGRQNDGSARLSGRIEQFSTGRQVDFGFRWRFRY